MKHNFSIPFFFGIFLFSWLVVNHIEAAKKLEPTWNKFSQTATTGSYTKETLVMNAGFDSAPILNFEHKLDRIIQERNQVLRANGYIAIGKWWVVRDMDGEVDPMNQCLYVCIGKW